MSTLPVYYLSHGGGPWPWMPDTPRYDQALADSLQKLPTQLPQTPTAILMVSAHWESQGAFLVQAHPQPPMYYDYYNFPPHTYQVQYPAPGKPELAQQVQQLLHQAGIRAELDHERGFDHGVFVPAYVMYPQAQIPIVQLSIEAHYEPAMHMAVGRALRSLRDQGVLIVGSGASYHNLRLLGPEGAEPSKLFDQWLEKALVGTTATERIQQLQQWDQAPAARIAHAREDHLVPLFTIAGAAFDTDTVQRILYSQSAAGIINASYQFG